jgi:ankyrin repeat protein
MQVLLEHGADIHASGNLAGATPLHVGSTAGSLAVVELLLKYGAEVSAKDIFGSSPLHDAANEQVPASPNASSPPPPFPQWWSRCQV